MPFQASPCGPTKDIMSTYHIHLFASHEFGFIHAQSKEMQPVVMRDRYSGEIIRTFDQGPQHDCGWGDPQSLFGPKPDRALIKIPKTAF